MTTEKLVETIAEGIKEKKGQQIVIADLRQIEGSIASFFVICQGSSPTQVEAITESVDETVKRQAGEDPLHVQGLGADQWVAMDYADVLVHIFMPEARQFYDLENLWEDANLTRLPDEE